VAHEAATGKTGPLQEAEPSLVNEAENVKALLSAFGRLHGNGH